MMTMNIKLQNDKNEVLKQVTKKSIRGLFLTPYFVYKFILLMLLTFPVSIIFAISATLLDHTILTENKYHLMKLFIDRFDMIFNYGLGLSLFLALSIMLLEPFRKLLTHVSDSVVPIK